MEFPLKKLGKGSYPLLDRPHLSVVTIEQLFITFRMTCMTCYLTLGQLTKKMHE